MDALERIEMLARGYQDSAILLTALTEGLIAAIGERPLTSEAAAAALDLDGRAVDILLHALASQRIAIKAADGRFSLDPACAEVLLEGGEASQTRILAHHFHLMRRWSRLDEVLRTGKPVPRERTPRQHRDYICGMRDISRKSSRDVAGGIDFSTARRLLDLGGGPATSALTFAAAYPDLTCVVFDLPATAAIAREVITASGLGDRVTAVEGDYFVDDFGADFDVVYISNIIHSVDADTVAMIARKAHAALVPGGRVMIKDFFLADDRISPDFAARFAVNMLVGTEAGRVYTEAETRDLLEGEGFSGFESVPTAKHSKVLIGYK